MYQGGGNLTHAWYGMAYAGQAGKRVPVPISRLWKTFVVYLIALWAERKIARRGGPVGIVVTVAVTLYGAARFNDEYVLLPHNTGGDIAVLVASLAFVGCGAALAAWLLWRDRGVAHEQGIDPWRAPAAEATSVTAEVHGAGSADFPEGAKGAGANEDGDSAGGDALNQLRRNHQAGIGLNPSP